MMSKANDEWKGQVNHRLEELERMVYEYSKQLDKVLIDVTTIKEQNNRILDKQHKLGGKIVETAQNAISEATEPIREAMDEFVEKKVIPVTEKQVEKVKESKSFWNKIRSWK